MYLDIVSQLIQKPFLDLNSLTSGLYLLQEIDFVSRPFKFSGTNFSENLIKLKNGQHLFIHGFVPEAVHTGLKSQFLNEVKINIIRRESYGEKN